MGSVKDLEVLMEPTKERMGVGRFHFSDRYSVFDWGEMPDHIPYKGEAIALLGAYFFEKLEEMDISTHYMGIVEDGEVKRLSDVKRPANKIEIKLLRVISPKLQDTDYDYSVYREEKGGFLVPLEVIYRNFLPAGSSVFRRLKDGEICLADLNLSSMPLPNQKLDSPFLDYSTKLEITDRYLTRERARSIAGLSDDEILEIEGIVIDVNDLITKEFSKIGLVNEDGKVELGFDLKRCFMLVDVLGTLDECRVTFDGTPVSKEIARIYYRKTEWHHAVEEAKKKDRQHWRETCELSPEPLPEMLKLLISQIYCAVTNEVTQRTWFKDLPTLKELLKDIKEALNVDDKRC